MKTVFFKQKYDLCLLPTFQLIFLWYLTFISIEIVFLQFIKVDIKGWCQIPIEGNPMQPRNSKSLL